jgi:hypothetical protein
MASTGYDYKIVDESGAVMGSRDAIPLCVWGFREACLISLFPSLHVSGSICAFPATLSEVCIGSLNVIGADEALPSSVFH